MWILISWLHQKPADLDLHCFQKKWINLGSAGQELKFIQTISLGIGAYVQNEQFQGLLFILFASNPFSFIQPSKLACSLLHIQYFKGLLTL